MNRTFNLNSPFGDTLRFDRLTGHEGVSQLFEFRLECTSDSPDLLPADALGRCFSIEIDRGDEAPRHLSGHCTGFRASGREGDRHAYEAILRPGLWYATRRTDFRIFQNTSVVEIVNEVLAAYPFPVRWETAADYSPWTYCVQYRETDANFVMRLLELEGLWFWFDHAAGEHTLVITDDIGLGSPLDGADTVPFHPGNSLAPGRDHLRTWSEAGQLTTGRYAARDYNFVMPGANLETVEQLAGAHPHADYESFDFPGEYHSVGEGQPITRVRMESMHAEHLRAACRGHIRSLAPGRLFTLEGHPVERRNREYLVLVCEYRFSDNGYEAGGGARALEVETLAHVHPSDQPYRPPRRTGKPTASGPDSAVVTGPAGQEIHTDEHGRVKVQFHWDRYGRRDENSSCWIRVSHPWAGSGFGGVHIPRIGQEVIVDYLNGDPDQPIIVGRVYNTMQPHPWGLPENASQSGFLTRSTLGGNAETANALRFEDKRGEEQLWIHAERNQDIEVEHDETHWVGNDRSKTIDRDETTHVKRDRTETVDRDETIAVHGERTETVDGNETITIHSNRRERVDGNESIGIGGNRTENVERNETVGIDGNRSKTVGRNETDRIGRNWSIKVAKVKTETIGMASMQNVGLGKMTNVGLGYNRNVGAMMVSVVGLSRNDTVGRSHTARVGDTYTLTAGGGASLVMDRDSILIEVGKSRIVLESGGTITLEGTQISIKGDTLVDIDGKKIDLN